MWAKEKPTTEGWYFWRKRKTQNDPFNWLAFFVDRDGEVWESGTNVTDPPGGWWSVKPVEL